MVLGNIDKGVNGGALSGILDSLLGRVNMVLGSLLNLDFCAVRKADAFADFRLCYTCAVCLWIVTAPCKRSTRWWALGLCLILFACIRIHPCFQSLPIETVIKFVAVHAAVHFNCQVLSVEDPQSFLQRQDLHHLHS